MATDTDTTAPSKNADSDNNVESIDLQKPKDNSMYDVPESARLHKSIPVECEPPEGARIIDCPAGSDDGDCLGDTAAYHMKAKSGISLTACSTFKKVTILLLGLAAAAVVSVMVGREVVKSRRGQSTTIISNDDNCISSDQNYTSQALQDEVYPDLSFYILGDVPYTREEESVLIDQLKDIRSNVSAGTDSSLFMVHVGDLQHSPSTNCAERSYTVVSDIMKTYSPIPILTLVGDNDWNDCPSPSLAFSYYEKYFVGLEKSWDSTSSIPSLVQRSCDRAENFVFFYSGVLFVSVNTVAGASISSAADSERHEQNSAWLNANFDRYLDAARAVVVFGHSTEAESVFQTIKSRIASRSLPIVYLHGNGHAWNIERNVNSIDMPSSFNAVQVDQGGKAPPVKVTIRGNSAEALEKNFYEENASQFVLADVFKLDRGNGLYTEAQLQSIENAKR